MKESRQDEVITAIQSLFTDEIAAKIMTTKALWRRRKSGLAASGFDYVAAWAFFTLMGGGAKGLLVKKNASLGAEHYWVEGRDGEIIDVASEHDGSFHYAGGITCYHCSDHSTAQIFLDRVNAALHLAKTAVG